MNFSMILFLLGRVFLCEGALLLLPTIVSFGYKEYPTVNAFLITIGICLLLGILFSAKKPKNNVFHLKEGFVVTGFTWIFISILGAIPFVLTGVIPNPIDAMFEVVSGFTTTGSSILTDVEILPKGLIFWRSFTHWIGGMGVLVFLLMVTPLKGGSHANIMKAESPGPQVEKLVSKTQSTAGILYGIYISMTLVQIVLLLLGNMPWFDAVTVTFGTAGTGGFGIKNDSMASYSPYIQNVVSIFMILFGINFSFYFLLLLRKVKKAFLMEEVRWYLMIILIAIGLIAWNTFDFYQSFEETFRHALFQVGSIITTTGYSTTDFNLWSEFSKTILVILMFIGACAGSTGGGMKVSRFVLLFKTIKKEIRTFLHPSQIGKISVDGKVIPHEVIRSVNVYLITYFVIFAASLLLISLNNLDAVTNFTAITTTFNNIGPGLSLVGPLGNFSMFSNFSKIILIFDMLAGRLELFPILLLFSKETWRKF